ncbi:MAG: prolyl oligopeptidase family serine peptidase [Propionibacteriales bacterium]|nr:prolyl oligopeptidase family serine peptidase [Propionibacteriales bacterium]
MAPELLFPRQLARTMRFALGAPRSFVIAPDGARVAFLRSGSGVDRVNQLWVLDLDRGDAAERVIADPGQLLDGADEELSPEERHRRERSREGSGGIVGYATDEAVQTAVFMLSGRVFTASLVTGAITELDIPGPVADPQPAPDGAHIAYVTAGALRVVAADGSHDRPVAEPDRDDVSWGLAEFIAAEEMDRHRGFWWSPLGDRLLAARVDNGPVQSWWIADPANPSTPPAPIRYPAAGTPNADVSLYLVGLDGSRTEISWDRISYPYLARVHWSSDGPPVLLVQARDQQHQQILSVDVDTATTSVVLDEHDADWLDLFDGVPAWMPDGRLVHIAERGGARVLTVDDQPVTDSTLHVRSVLAVGADGVLIRASAGEAASEPKLGEIHVYRVNGHGTERLSDHPGVHTAVASGSLMVLSSSSLDWHGNLIQVVRDGRPVSTIASLQERPVITARPRLVLAGDRRIPCAVLLPAGYASSTGLLPVLMDPYGGPMGQRVMASHNTHLTSQWLADQGFAVIVADGRGMPGRNPAWEKAVRNNLAQIPLDDQVEALHSLVDRFPLDLGRVAIRGWSFGGYLAALATLRRPDVFHAAVVGAPVTDLRLYDTHYQERYLGLPDEQPEVYAANSVVTDDGLSEAVEPHRPMMIIHGLADDNVVVAHTLRLSSALLAAGRPHEVIPLSGVTHMTPQEKVAENLLLLQVDFLKRSLGMSQANDHL